MTCPVLVKFVIPYNFLETRGKPRGFAWEKLTGSYLSYWTCRPAMNVESTCLFHILTEIQAVGDGLLQLDTERIQLSRAIARSRMLRVSFEL